VKGACRDQQMLEKKAKKHHEAAAAREADMDMERERQRAIFAAQVLRFCNLGGSSQASNSHNVRILADENSSSTNHTQLSIGSSLQQPAVQSHQALESWTCRFAG